MIEVFFFHFYKMAYNTTAKHELQRETTMNDQNRRHYKQFYDIEIFVLNFTKINRILSDPTFKNIN